MTTTGAYDAGLPCKNPSCKSRGSPHPNCRCYPSLLAKGGSAQFRCDGPHKPDCEYYTAHAPTPVDDIAASLAHHGFSGLIDGITAKDHLDGIRKGNAAIKSALDSLFDGGMPDRGRDKKLRDKVHEYLERGGIDQSLKEANYPEEPQKFAKGGIVERHKKSISPLLKDTSLADSMPAHNIMLNATKSKISNYLNSLRPESKSLKLPFDAEPDHTPEKRSYHQAIDLANNPLSILGEIGRGSLEPGHVQHLSGMSPELTDHLQKRITERVMKAQIDEKKPSHKVRQGLSMFMGSPLSSDLTPASLLAAQATFAPKTPPPPPPGKAKRGTSKLGKSDQAFLTGDQAREMRGQKQ